MTSTAACTTYSSVSVSTSIVSTTVVTSSFSSTLPYPTTAATAKASQPLNPDNYCPQNFPYYYAWCNLCYNYGSLACNATGESPHSCRCPILIPAQPLGPDPCIIPGAFHMPAVTRPSSHVVTRFCYLSRQLQQLPGGQCTRGQLRHPNRPLF